LPQVNPATIALLVVALLGAAWAAGLLRAHYEEGRATLRVTRADRVLVTLNVRDTWLLLALSLLIGAPAGLALARYAFRGRDASVEPLLEERGLKGTPQ